MSESRNRPDMPKWFKVEDAKFFREEMSESLWLRIKNSMEKQAISEFCQQHGLNPEDVDRFWYKTDEFSVLVKGDSTQKEKQTTKEIFQNIFESFVDYKIPSLNFEKVESTGKCAIINMYDAHLDKIALDSETGESSTIEDNVVRYNRGFDLLLNGILSHKPDTIIFPVGNDFFHANDMTGRTKKGTPIQYLGSPEEAYSVVCNVAIENIIKLAATGANVIIPFIKGNHDEDNITILSFWLEKVFQNIENVTFLSNRLQRKYIQYGVNMFGFAHGDKEKSKVAQLPLLMATENKEMWANTTYRTFYCGDLHHGFEHNFARTKDQPGVEVRFLRSVGCSDKWHVDHGWIGIPKTGYAEVWSKDNGRVGSFEVNL